MLIVDSKKIMTEKQVIFTKNLDFL